MALVLFMALTNIAILRKLLPLSEPQFLIFKRRQLVQRPLRPPSSMLNVCDHAQSLRGRKGNGCSFFPPPTRSVSLQPLAAAPRGGLTGDMLFHCGEYLHHDPHSQGLAALGGRDPWFREDGRPRMRFNECMLTGPGAIRPGEWAGIQTA